MSLDTYANLQTELAGWLNRSDMTSQIPTFITLAEVEIAQRVRRKVLRSTFTIAANQATLPTTISAFRTMRLSTGTPSLDTPIDIVSLEDVYAYRAKFGGSTGRPTYAAIVGTEIHVAPTPDTTYTIEYVGYEKLIPLATASPNSVLTEAPSVYLYGALREAELYLEHDERVAVWAGKFDKAIEDLNQARRNEEFNASKRKARLPVTFG